MRTGFLCGAFLALLACNALQVMRGLSLFDFGTESLASIVKITQHLESYQGNRYYVYTNTNLSLPDIRVKAKNFSTPTWGNRLWTSRFKSYALGEIRYIEALEQYTNSNLRTFNIEDADFVVVPIPLSAAVFWGDATDVTLAFGHLFHGEPFFKQHPEKHLYIAIIERLLRGDYESINHFHGCCGVSLDVVVNISKGILVKDFDAPSFRWFILNKTGSDWGIYNQDNQVARPLFRSQWSLGYAHECSDPSYPFLDVTNFEHWNSKNLTIFYRTVTRTSLYNSTIYRHALVKNQEEQELPFPGSSVGFNIPHEQWLNDFQNSKYCLIVRGDNPSSRSLFTAIRFGCMPLIVSDALPYYQPIFRSLLKYEDFSIVIDEGKFLLRPAEELNDAIKSLSRNELKARISGLALLQRILVLDHPRSLFVPAFVHETVHRQFDQLPYLFMESTPASISEYRSFAKSHDF